MRSLRVCPSVKAGRVAEEAIPEYEAVTGPRRAPTRLASEVGGADIAAGDFVVLDVPDGACGALLDGSVTNRRRVSMGALDVQTAPYSASGTKAPT